MPIQGQLKGKIPTQQRDKSRIAGEAPNADISAGVSQQTQEITQQRSAGVSNEDNKELLRKNSAILENLNLMYETIHNETQLLKTLKQETTTKEEPPIFEKKQVTPQQNDVLCSGSTSPNADKSARVLEPKKKTNKSTLPGVSKSMIPLFTQQRDKSRVAAVGPNADISAGVFKKKPHQQAPALLPRWK